MPLKQKLTIILCCIIGVGYAQSDSLRRNKLSVEIPLLNYLDALDGPSYRVGAEVNLWHNISAYLEGGGYFGLNGHDWLTEQFSDGRLTEVKGYLAHTEVKYYWNRQSSTQGLYVSIEAAYKKESYNWQDSIHLSPPYLTTFREFKSVYWFDADVGYVFILRKYFIFDLYGGLGIRFKSITSTLNPQQIGALQYNDDSNYDSDETGIMIEPGKSIYPNLSLGFRIGYCIK